MSSKKDESLSKSIFNLASKINLISKKIKIANFEIEQY